MSSPKETILRALSTLRGDDLHRARAAFRHYTPEQMKQEYGQSGRTPTQILAEYEAHEREVDAAVALAQTLP